jgi:hypothetical protein
MSPQSVVCWVLCGLCFLGYNAGGGGYEAFVSAWAFAFLAMLFDIRARVGRLAAPPEPPPLPPSPPKDTSLWVEPPMPADDL